MKNYNTAKVISWRADSYIKAAYSASLRSSETRENHISLRDKIDRQRSESINIYSSKHLIEKESVTSKPSNQEFIDNHVAKFSFATKAGKSLRNPRK